MTSGSTDGSDTASSDTDDSDHAVVCLLIGDDGICREVRLADNETTLAASAKLTDSDFVDCVAADGFDVWVSDDGLARSDFTVNTAASSLLAAHGAPGHRIVGPVAVFRCDHRTGETVGLDPDTLRVLRHELGELSCTALPPSGTSEAADQQHASRQQRLELDYPGHGLRPRSAVTTLSEQQFADMAAHAAAQARSQPPTDPQGGLCGTPTADNTPCRHPRPPRGGQCAAGHRR